MPLRVLVAGAGPSGLVAAIDLARRGLSVRIIDKAEDFATQSRAIGINPRTLAILAPSGASQALLAEGIRISGANLHYPGDRVARLDFARLKVAHPFMLALPQSRTERILAQVLETLGVRVEHGTAFSSFEDSGSMLYCMLEGPAGGSSYEATHLVGADGARSLVRETAGIGFPGDALEAEWTLADLRMDWPFPKDRVNVFFGRSGFLFTITLGEDRFRIVSPDASLEASLPNGARITEVLWRSTFRVRHHLAERYHAGRVFLAGDAAHLHSPLGARGMNMGIADAATLAWLLSEGREAAYTEVRRPVGARTVALVKRQTHQAVSSGPLQRRLAAMIAPWSLRLGPIQRLAGRFVTGLNDPPPEWL